MRPKITCAILCYNYGRYLRQSIESCLSQTIPQEDYEILVIDDGSTDETQNICIEYKNKIRVSRTDNLGFSRSLARAIEEAKGEYVAYLDADDWWTPNKLKAVLPFIDNGYLLILHPLIETNMHGDKFGKIGSVGNTSTICVNRKAALTLLPGTSEIYCHPLLKVGKGKIIDSPLGFYRIHNDSMTDRAPGGSHTEFFARTTHFTANRLFQLSKKLPYWAKNENQILNLANWYNAEALIKDFERYTELKCKRLIKQNLIKTIYSILKGKHAFKVREIKLFLRGIHILFS